MAVLVRLTDFIPNTLIQSAQVDAEFQQLVDILSGVSTSKNAVITYSHATDPPLALNQTNTGFIQQWKQSGVEVARVEVDGRFVTAGLEITSTTPTLTLTDTNAEDFRIQANGDQLVIDGLTGPVTFMTFRGGANDDIQIARPTTITHAGDALTIVANALAGGIRISGNNSPLNRVTNTGTNGGSLDFGLATTATNFSAISLAGDAILRTVDQTGNGHFLFVLANTVGAFKFSSGSAGSDTLKAIITNAGLMGVNRASPGSQLDVLSGSTSRVGLIVDNPSGTTVNVAEFKVNASNVLVFKNNGQIVGVPKCVHTNGNATGNVGGGLDSLHSFNLPAGSLAANGDYLDVAYCGLFAANDQDKRIVLSFGGQTYGDTQFDLDNAYGWTYFLRILRLTSTTVRVARMTTWGFISRDGGGTAGGNGFLAGDNSTLTVSDLGSNSMTMLVQAESIGGAPNNDDIVQNLSIIELVQNT